MRKFSKKQYIIAGAAALAIAGAAGGAYAYWSSSGTGGGTATTGSSSGFVVTVDSTNLADLTPGGTTETVTFHVNNPGSGSENLANTIASVTGTEKPVGTPDAGCTAADFNVGTPVITYGEITGGGTVNGTFTLQMKDTSSNQDACQNATVDLSVAAS